MSARLTGLFVARPSPRRNALEPVLQACTIVLALLMPATSETQSVSSGPAAMRA